MEIVGFGTAWLSLLLMGLLLWCGAAVVLSACRRVRIRVRVRRPGPPSASVARFTSLLGFALALGSGTAAAQPRRPLPPVRHAQQAAPPWSGAGGYPPPRSLARTEAVSDPETTVRRSHPAIHGRVSHPSDDASPRLFPRARRHETNHSGERDASERERRERAMAAHPAGKTNSSKHRVKRGESLWSIADRALTTDDPSVIARYSRRLYRINRSIIGGDPNLILPGQVLDLSERS